MSKWSLWGNHVNCFWIFHLSCGLVKYHHTKTIHLVFRVITHSGLQGDHSFWYPGWSLILVSRVITHSGLQSDHSFWSPEWSLILVSRMITHSGLQSDHSFTCSCWNIPCVIRVDISGKKKSCVCKTFTWHWRRVQKVTASVNRWGR